MATSLAAILLLLASAPAPGRPGRTVTLVAAAPGYPGTTAEAQPSMDALAAAAARAAGWPERSIAGVYLPAEQDGVARLERPDAAVALVTLPFYAKHGSALRLAARLAVVTQGQQLPSEVWTLVAGKGRIASPAALAGFTVASTAGYAPGFVRGVLAGWGPLPDGAQVVQSSQVLSALRKAASGADVAVLLDGAQSAALGSLPFADELEVVARSAPVPSAVVATVGDRLSPARWRALEKALLALPSAPGGGAALEGLRMARFVPLDPGAIAAARQLGAGTHR
jgi:hypothetical protein